MIKIGLLGCESSHASAFSTLANVPDANGVYAFTDVRVTHVFGLDNAQARALATKCLIPSAVSDPAQMLGHVDAIMVLFRDGSLHYRYAQPFCSRGIPVWVDKPFTLSTAEVEALVQMAKQRGGVLAGGSTCKYCADILAVKAFYEENKAQVVSAMFNFPGMPDSPYHGVHFYMPHAAEMLLTVFGQEIKSVTALFSHNTQMAAVDYQSFSAIVNFVMTEEYQFTIFTPDRLFTARLDMAGIYQHGFAKFVQAIRQNCIVEPYESLIAPVKLVNALEQAIKTGKTILLSQ